MKPSAIALLIAKKPGSATGSASSPSRSPTRFASLPSDDSDPLDPTDLDPEGDETDLKLDEPQDYPVLYLSDLRDLPPWLKDGYQGRVTFEVRRVEREDDPDGTSDLELELASMEAEPSTVGSSPDDSRAQIDRAFAAAEQMNKGR